MAEALVDRVGLLGVIDDSLYKAIAPQISKKRVLAGSVVFRVGDPVDGLYLIAKGRVCVTLEVDGQRMVLAEIDAGGFFGEMSLFENRARSTTVEAVEDCDLLLVPATVIHQILDRDPESAGQLYRVFFLKAVHRILHSNTVVADYFRSRLEQLERERQEKEFMQLLAHDLRSPLAIAESGLTQLLERTEKYGALTQAQERILKRSRRSMLFLHQLLEEILEVGRSESGVSRAEPATLAGILLEAIPQSLVAVSGPTLEQGPEANDFESLRALLAPQGLSFDIEPAVLHAPIQVDRLRLIQVLMNLVSNALKYAPGAVSVQIRRQAGRLEVAVHDRGPGIPEAFRSIIFDRYRQAGAKAEGVRRGFGLGLAGARQLVEAMEGEIRAEPGPGGVGTTIAFHIPWIAPA